MALRPQVLRAYRDLLRTIHVVFRADSTAVRHCKGEARKGFSQHIAESDPTRIQKLIVEAADATEFLRQHIAQAALNQQGRYGAFGPR
jgi:complex III assembly factor LYRM7